jgi:hypothetical protein
MLMTANGSVEPLAARVRRGADERQTLRKNETKPEDARKAVPDGVWHTFAARTSALSPLSLMLGTEAELTN